MSEEYFQEAQTWKESDFVKIPECHSQKQPTGKAAPKKRKSTTPKKKKINNFDALFNEEKELIVDPNFETPKKKMKGSTKITHAPKKTIVSKEKISKIL